MITVCLRDFLHAPDTNIFVKGQSLADLVSNSRQAEQWGSTTAAACCHAARCWFIDMESNRRDKLNSSQLYSDVMQDLVQKWRVQ